MRQADAFDSTPHRENLSRILSRAFQLVELAGEEQDAVHREMLTAECMACWRAAQRLRPMAQPYIEGLIMGMTMQALWPL